MQARLRAQLGDRSKYSGERRRRSVVVASIVLTITDPLRGSYPLLCNLQAALIRSCGASFACMELTIISRFQRLQASTKSLLHPLFYSFSVLSPSACFQCVDNCCLHRNMPKACPYVMMKSQIWHTLLFFGFNMKFFPKKVCDEIPLGVFLGAPYFRRVRICFSASMMSEPL